ncbi:hypothetical protein HJFPF1_02856 [Paramyrothecium foliicola]|nr:hypothetical protein HJFPF1_02856 [Paramyrothecium foliicola]
MAEFKAMDWAPASVPAAAALCILLDLRRVIIVTFIANPIPFHGVEPIAGVPTRLRLRLHLHPRLRLFSVGLYLGTCLYQHGRLRDCAFQFAPTAPHATKTASPTVEPASLDANDNPRINSISLQPSYPSPVVPSPVPSEAAAFTLPREPPTRPPPIHIQSGSFFPRKPTLGVLKTSLPRTRPQTASRLWNPVNSTPRSKPPARKRRPSTPPPPSVPLGNQAFDDPSHTRGRPLTRAEDSPLLTLPEQRQSRLGTSARSSLQVEGGSDWSRRISLPTSVRLSYDGKSQPTSPTTAYAQLTANQSLVGPTKLDKGKGKAIMAPENEETTRAFSSDLERGHNVNEHRLSNLSAGDGIGSALSSSDSSIMGEDVQADAGLEWGPLHPCYPHLNPHVPVESAEYANTRIVRIRRDWLLQGDLAPTFSNLYPEILDPAGLSEEEFRRVIDKLNAELVPVFNPYSLRNIMDGVLGLATGWLWDDFGLTGIKTRLNNLEKWIDQWNQEMEKAIASEEGMVPPKLISLRQTGYMNLDIQIMDPECAAPSTHGANDSHTALPQEPPAAVVV